MVITNSHIDNNQLGEVGGEGEGDSEGEWSYRWGTVTTTCWGGDGVFSKSSTKSLERIFFV